MRLLWFSGLLLQDMILKVLLGSYVVSVLLCCYTVAKIRVVGNAVARLFLEVTKVRRC